MGEDEWNSGDEGGQTNTEYYSGPATTFYNKSMNRGQRQGYNNRNESSSYDDRNSGGSNFNRDQRGRGRGFGGRGRGRGVDRGRDDFGGRNYRSGGDSRDDSSNNWRRDNSYNDTTSSSSSESITIEINASDVGRIIGKGGSRIRELQESTGANIKISRNDNPVETVTIKGSAECQKKAKEEIERIIGNVPNYTRTEGFSSSFNSNSDYHSRRDDEPAINWSEINRQYEEAQKVKWSKLPPLKKDFYFEDPEVRDMHPERVKEIRKANNNIVVAHTFEESKEPIANPVITFEQAFRDYPDVMAEIRKQNFTKPSPIQCQAWPLLLKGQDVIGIAQTGTGKTLAFLLPALIHTDGQPVPRSQRGGPNVIVLAPTRELALQIESEVKKYNYKGIRCVCVYGGGSRQEQVDLVCEGVEIVIATPGRLNDLVSAGIISVTSVTYLVLDEADRMLDMGFEPQIRKTLIDVRPDRQTVMTSATWPENVRRLAKSYMKDPIQVYVGSLDLAATHTVTQIIEIINEEEKERFLYDFIGSMQPDDKVIVFVGKKARADDLASELCLHQVSCQSIHGDREQCDREQALEDIKDGTVRILIATDVASRGIDIPDITHIFNFDFPRNIEEYVHRVGRTGRAGKEGESISLFTRADWGSARELIAILDEANQSIPEELYNMADRFDAMKRKREEEGGFRGRGGGRGGGGGGRFGGGGGGGGGRGGRNKW